MRPILEEFGFLARVLSSAVGYTRTFRGPGEVVRSTPESRHSSGDVRFDGCLVWFTPGSGQWRARAMRAGYDPEPTFSPDGLHNQPPIEFTLHAPGRERSRWPKSASRGD